LDRKEFVYYRKPDALPCVSVAKRGGASSRNARVRSVDLAQRKLGDIAGVVG